MSENGGDRELVLGNKQLLAIFFVAALLCGVFFAVGYVVGGNSAKSGIASANETASTQSSDGKREEPSSQSPIASDTAATATPAPTPTPTDAGGPLPGAEPRMADNPAAAGSLPPAPVPVPPVSQVPAQPVQSVPASKPAAPYSAPAATGVFISEPEKGASYWQVTAAKRPNADDLVRALREARLPAILANSSKPDLFEVLVGPYRSPLTLSEAKRKLTDLGYNGIVIHKQ